jgi:hypothetical protein
MPYVYSTATCSTAYVKYKPTSANGGGAGHNLVLKKVIINGGHGLNTKHMITPKGIVTQVSDEDMEFLLQDQNFLRHVDAGFITYDKKKIDPEKKANNMADKDGSAPLTPADFEKGENDEGDLRVYKGTPKSKPF